MASTSISLKDSNSEGLTRIVCLLRDGRDVRIKIYSDYSVKPKHWSRRTKTVLSSNNNAAKINTELEVFKNAVLNVYLDAKKRGVVANTKFINESLKPSKVLSIENLFFWDVWNYYIEANRHKFQIRTIKKLSGFRNHLKKFESFRRIPLQLNTITVSTLDELQTYFYEQAGLNTGTTAKNIGLLKMFLNWTLKNKYSTNTDHKQFVAIQQPDSLKVVFTKEDLGKIRSVNLGDKDYLKNVRQLLILSTLTGLRYSDFSAIRSEHLKQEEDGKPFLFKRQEKTSDFVEIPLIPESEQITHDLVSGKVHSISNQKMNKYVKELCKLAEVNESCEVHEFKGKMKITKYQPKYELVSTHTGRRTFATNLLLQDVPAEIIMKFTGHRDYKSFAKYVNIPKKNLMKTVKMALMR